MPTDTLVRLDLAFAPCHEDLLTGVLYLHVPWGWQDDGVLEGARRVSVHFDRPEHSADLEAVLRASCPEIVVTRCVVDNADWTTAWKQFFTPIAIGSRFVVLPAWRRGEACDAEPILIEPKMAFGTGHHHTTALCLHALADLAACGTLRAGQTFLDLGTGSGILAIAAAKLGLSGLAVDIDPVAIDNAHENCALNSVHDKVNVAVGSIADVSPSRRFDCIVANILANPLIDMACPVCERLARPGVLVLSGILREQADKVSAAYVACGMPQPEVNYAQDWAALLFRA